MRGFDQKPLKFKQTEENRNLLSEENFSFTKKQRLYSVVTTHQEKKLENFDFILCIRLIHD